MTGDDWARLRATRSAVPAAAADDRERRQTYVFALEQAEQLIRSAATVGPATQPLLIFYGLSQAGRAIAAAAKSAREDDWRLEGHGIHSVAATLRGPLPDVKVRTDEPDRKGSFVRLSKLLGSPVWGKTVEVPLHRLWDAVPENRHWPIGPADQARRTSLYVDYTPSSAEHPLVTASICYFPPWLIDSTQGRDDLNTYMAAFPDAAHYADYYRVSGAPDANPNFTRHDTGWGELGMHWQAANGERATNQTRQDYVTSMTRLYKGSRYLFPDVCGAGTGLHPLMAWWAVLHTLSMLARYQPAEWASHVNVDASSQAVPIENALQVAIDTVPALVAEAIAHIQ